MKDEKQKPHILHLRDKMLSLSPEVTEWIGGITLNLFVLQSEFGSTSEALSNLPKQHQVAFITSSCILGHNQLELGRLRAVVDAADLAVART